MFKGKRRKKSTARRVEIQSAIWLPEASHFGKLLESNGIRYAMFGAGALAVHRVMVRPTIDIDFVVDDYKNAIALLQNQQGIVSKNLKKDKDGIQVADFYFQSGVTVQIWDNNLYSLPMSPDSWSRLSGRVVPGYDLIQTISMEDLIVFFELTKKGRYDKFKGLLTHYAIMEKLEQFRQERYAAYVRIKEQKEAEVRLLGPQERISPEPTPIKKLFEDGKVIPFKMTS